MSTKFFSVALLGILSLSAFAEPGDKGGNGGGGHFCANGNNEVYDLQEGRVRYHIPVLNLSGSNDETIELGLEKVKKQFPVFSYMLKLEVELVKKKMELLNMKIERTLDSDNLYVEETCEYLQIANWDTTVDRLIVSKSRYALLSDAQKGVLIMHEAAYSLYRSNKVGLQSEETGQSVDPVRKFIAQVYSTDEISTLLVKTPFLSGGIFAVESISKINNSYSPKTRIQDQALVENPFCNSSEYRISFSNYSDYNIVPYFGNAPGVLIKAKKPQVLDFKVNELPIRYAIQDFTNIERIAVGNVLDNSYDPTTAAFVKVNVERVGCGEKGSFYAQCGITKSLGVFKKAQCADSFISRYQF